MTLDQFVSKYSGQSVLWAASSARESLRGQCVQLACFYVQEVWNAPVIWANAVVWYRGNAAPEYYDRFPYKPGSAPQRGDLVVWGESLPNSGGGGHIAICLSSNASNFVSFDSNWGGKTAHQVTHNYNYVVGWLRPKAIPTATQGGVEMIATRQEAVEIYCLLRPNGGPSEGELAATVGRRSYASFLSDAQNEVNVRNAALIHQQEALNNMQTQISQQNKAITDLTSQLADARLTSQQKQQVFNEAMSKITATNTELATAHGQITDLQKQVEEAKKVSRQQVIEESTTVPTPNVSPFTKLLAKLIKPKK